MWFIVDKRLETGKLHFAESEAKRDVRRIYRRNVDIEVNEEADRKTQNAEYAKGNSANPLPKPMFFTGEDFDLPFRYTTWDELFNDPDDLEQGPAMTEEEYKSGSDPRDDKVGLAALGGDDDIDDVLASLDEDDEEEVEV